MNEEWDKPLRELRELTHALVECALPTILIVEDYQPMAEMLETGMRELASNPIQVFHTAEEALEWLHGERDCGLMLLDIRLPGMSGLQLLYHLRTCADGCGQDLPVVILSNYDDLELREEADRLGVVAFLAKPFNFEQLLLRSQQVGIRWGLMRA